MSALRLRPASRHLARALAGGAIVAALALVPAVTASATTLSNGSEVFGIGCDTSTFPGTSSIVSVSLSSPVEVALDTPIQYSGAVTGCFFQGDFGTDGLVYTFGATSSGATVLVVVDPATGIAIDGPTLVGPPSNVLGLAVSRDGTIYVSYLNGSSNPQARIGRVDASTGVVTPIIDSQGPTDYGNALTFDPDSDLLYNVTVAGAVVEYDLTTTPATRRTLGSLHSFGVPPIASSAQISDGIIYYYPPAADQGFYRIALADIGSASPGNVENLGNPATSGVPTLTSLLISPAPVTTTPGTPPVTTAPESTPSGESTTQATAVTGAQLAETGVDAPIGLAIAAALTVLAGASSMTIARARRRRA